jgi:menaquinone-specific isochorismate synthase
MSFALAPVLSIRTALARQVSRVLARGNGPARLIQVAVPVQGLDRWAWLAAQEAGVKCYWADRSSGEAVAAMGVADETGAGADLEAARRQVETLLGTTEAPVRYVGGGRFDPTTVPEDHWAPFGTLRFFLPRFELRVGPDVTLLACNLVLPRDQAQASTLLEQIERLRFPETALTGTLPLPFARRNTPDCDRWHANIHRALESFQQTSLKKVVLARRATFDFAEDVDPVLLLQRLEAATPGCFHYYLQPRPGLAFLGASPERLFRRDGRSICSEAVAGTRPRGESWQSDAVLREALLHSEKDQREHAYVRTHLEATLKPLCEVLHVETEASEMKLARGRHLVSGITGTLHAGISTFDLLRALHPTPAVGGTPRREACAAIRQQEPFDRGWYAGPLGWIERDAAEFAVALRCGLVTPRHLALYSGAGIVRGSVPAAEWDEIEHKISDFMQVLGLDLRRAE